MKLLKCYIENFGKLHNYEHTFQDGLNIIKEDNGFGKTTFAIFIKSMFYGLEAKKNAKVEKYERKKYFPWQGGNYGGNIEFEINGKKYRIERFFGKKESDDTFKLYDLSTNLQCNDYTENIGEEIFKLNNSAYERSTYIPQGQIQIEMEDTISAKLGNVLESENDINTSEKALNLINETKKRYIKDRGKGGLIDERKEQLNLLKRTLENCQTDTENLKIKEKKLKEINEQIKEKNINYENEQKLLTKELENERKIAKLETYKKIIEKYNQYKSKINELNDFFKNNVPEEKDLRALLQKNIELENMKSQINNNRFPLLEMEKINSLKEKYSKKDISTEEIDIAIKECYKMPEIEKEIEINKNIQKQIENEADKNKKISFIVKCVGAIAIIVGLILFLSNIQKIGGIIGFLFGVIIIITSFLLFKKKELKKEYRKEIDELETEKEKNEQHIVYILKQFNSEENNAYLNNQQKLAELDKLKAEINMYNDLMNRKKANEQEIEKLKLKKENLDKEINMFIKNFYNNINEPYTELIQNLSLKRNEFISITEQLEKAKKEKEEFEKENNIEELNNIEKIDAIYEEDVKAKIVNLKAKIDELSDEKNQVKNQIEVLKNKIDDNEFLENDIENLTMEIEELNKKYIILNKTEALLKVAKEKFSSRYLQKMEDEFKKFLQIVDGEKLNTNVDINLDVKIEVNGSQKEVKYFSSGYKDLIYICMRFGLIKTLFEEESPFVILDDPLVNLDDSKTMKAINVINEMAKNYQIIYFVCNSSRVEN